MCIEYCVSFVARAFSVQDIGVFLLFLPSHSLPRLLFHTSAKVCQLIIACYFQPSLDQSPLLSFFLVELSLFLVLLRTQARTRAHAHAQHTHRNARTHTQPGAKSVCLSLSVILSHRCWSISRVFTRIRSRTRWLRHSVAYAAGMSGQANCFTSWRCHISK